LRVIYPKRRGMGAAASKPSRKQTAQCQDKAVFHGAINV
jgi:hypothetical protein